MKQRQDVSVDMKRVKFSQEVQSLLAFLEKIRCIFIPS